MRTGVCAQVCARVGSRAGYRDENERIKGLEGFNTLAKEAAQKILKRASAEHLKSRVNVYVF